MPRDSRKSVIQVLELAAYGHLPQELIEGENVPDVSIYHDLIDHGYLMGTILSDGRRPYFIESCHITAKGREYLMHLKREVRLQPLSWTWYIKPLLIGFLAGAAIGITLFMISIRANGLPIWLK